MYTSDFTSGMLRSLIRRRDRYEYNVLALPHLRDNYLKNLCEKINSNSFTFDEFRLLRVGKFPAFQPTRLGDTLVLRRLNKIIRSAYGLQQADRSAIISQAGILFSENCPKYVYKLDIQKFFESIRRDVILARIRTDGIISPTSIALLSTLFSGFNGRAKFGLPRGLAISTTLSELYLMSVDRLIPCITGVYYYARYVDDILVFSSAPIDNISDLISSELPRGMKLNEEKFRNYYFGCKCYPACKCNAVACACKKKCVCTAVGVEDVEYLGYKFQIPKVLASKDDRAVKVRIGIASSKMKRFKSRIVTAFLDHLKSVNVALLRRRIRFLTENHHIRTPANRGRLRSGIRYNYPLITDRVDLDEMNNFLRKHVFSRSGPYGSKLHGALSLVDKRAIAKLCFISGFETPRSRDLSNHAINQIRDCW